MATDKPLKGFNEGHDDFQKVTEKTHDGRLSPASYYHELLFTTAFLDKTGIGQSSQSFFRMIRQSLNVELIETIFELSVLVGSFVAQSEGQVLRFVRATVRQILKHGFLTRVEWHLEFGLVLRVGRGRYMLFLVVCRLLSYVM